MATLNLCSGRGPTGTHLDADGLAAALAGLDADVVSLQEVDVDQPRSAHVHQAAVAAAAVGASHWRFAPALIGTPGLTAAWTTAATVALVEPEPAGSGEREAGPAFGVALLSRQPVLRWQALSLGQGRAKLPLRVPDPRTGRPRTFWFPDEPRVALAAVLESFTVVGTHLSFSPATSLRQLWRLRRWASTLPGPVVLAGDLNLPGPLAQRWAGGHRLARGATFPGPDPRLQLDHVLALGPSGLTGSGVRTDLLDVGDHRALSVDIAYPGVGGR